MGILGLYVGCHFLLSGAVIATACWFISNKYLRVQSFHGVEQRMEWMCAFDIHCNSFFPLFLVLYVAHYFLLPLLVGPTLLAALLSNALYATAICYYAYITSLGYSTLPFLERTELFLYPSIPVALLIVLLSSLRINLPRLSIGSCVV